MEEYQIDDMIDEKEIDLMMKEYKTEVIGNMIENSNRIVDIFQNIEKNKKSYINKLKKMSPKEITFMNEYIQKIEKQSIVLNEYLENYMVEISNKNIIEKNSYISNIQNDREKTIKIFGSLLSFVLLYSIYSKKYEKNKNQI